MACLQRLAMHIVLQHAINRIRVILTELLISNSTGTQFQLFFFSILRLINNCSIFIFFLTAGRIRRRLVKVDISITHRWVIHIRNTKAVTMQVLECRLNCHQKLTAAANRRGSVRLKSVCSVLEKAMSVATRRTAIRARVTVLLHLPRHRTVHRSQKVHSISLDLCVEVLLTVRELRQYR